MLIISLFYTAVPIALTILMAILGKKKFSGLIALVPIYLLALLGTYFLLPSRNLLSILWGNLFWSIVWGAIELPINATDDWNFYDPLINKIEIGIITFLFCFAAFWGLHSHFTVKPTWNSINKKYSVSTEAPTFKRGETPIALAPNTVLNRVRKDSSDIPNTSYYTISDDVQAQFYKGKPVYIVSVGYNGFWQMRKAAKIPGYFMIDATKQNATPKFVKQSYDYATSAYFNHDARRQIYRRCPEWLDLDSPQLEINDKGEPFWIQTLYKPELLSHRVNYRKLHVAILNAKTGEVKNYSIHNLPKFVDEGITTGLANQLNWDFGKFKNGYWNTVFSNTDVMKPTKNGVENGVTSVFNKDGSISYFADFTTNHTGGDSSLGYSMINARTGQLTFYRASNIMDSDGAIHNANQNYKAQQWHAAMPILYNVNSHATWVMNILDQTHAIRGYYYLDANDQSIYGSGNSPISALDDFRQALVNLGSTAGNTNSASLKQIKGIIDRVAIISAQKKAMFTLKNSKIIYTVNTDDFENANLMRPNDKVSFSAEIVKGKPVGNVAKFKDETLR